MRERLRYHFDPKAGWINDPNGLCFFQGKYHAFFQHYPHALHWGPMHWGHAVSTDLIHWEELPIALTPDEPYEKSERGGGCFSGSAVVKDDVLYLIYTSVSDTLGQTQSVATSRDGIHFTKYEGNPVISHFPEDGSADFRDPKVTLFGDTYYMVCGSGRDGVGKVVLYASKDLFHWDYRGVLIQGEQFGSVIECPDFFPFAGGALLMFSKMNLDLFSAQFVYGEFSGDKFTPKQEFTLEGGPDFYAPQTLLAPDGRRLMMGWFYAWNRRDTSLDEDEMRVGALSLPRELILTEKGLLAAPIKEAAPFLTGEDPLVKRTEKGLSIACNWKTPIEYEGQVDKLEILRDGETLEVFVNGGATNFSTWIDRE